MKGQIVKIISDTHVVSLNNINYNCKCRGIFRKNKILPLVGDYVLFDKDKLIIEEILPRKNYFSRPKVANIDQVFIVTSLKQPDFSLNLLDRFITLMQLHNIAIIICLTKEDLLASSTYNKELNYYKNLGYKVISNRNLDEIKALLKNKTSVFTGQTGAGKSTLLNKLDSNLNLETDEISLALGRGKHTTRVVELFTILGGKLLDTPGFSALDFNSYSKEEIRDAFIEFNKYKCPYKDCMHLKEDKCSVKEALNCGEILPSRYNSYVKIINERR